MKKILIATHGMLADGFKSSINLLAGDSYDIKTINAYTDQCSGDYSDQILDFVNSVQGQDEGVIFTDLLSGSVNQKVCQVRVGKENVFVITGVNLMCILAVVLEIRPLNKEVLNEIIRESTVSLVEIETKKNSNEEVDFFK